MRTRHGGGLALALPYHTTNTRDGLTPRIFDRKMFSAMTSTSDSSRPPLKQKTWTDSGRSNRQPTAQQKLQLFKINTHPNTPQWATPQSGRPGARSAEMGRGFDPRDQKRPDFAPPSTTDLQSYWEKTDAERTLSQESNVRSGRPRARSEMARGLDPKDYERSDSSSPPTADLESYWEKTGAERICISSSSIFNRPRSILGEDRRRADIQSRRQRTMRETQSQSCSKALRLLSKIASALVLLQHPFSSATPTPNHDTNSDRPTRFTLLRWLEETSQEGSWSSLSPHYENAPATAFQPQRPTLLTMSSKTSSQNPKVPHDKPINPSSGSQRQPTPPDMSYALQRWLNETPQEGPPIRLNPFAQIPSASVADKAKRAYGSKQ
ncbi:hypothetical protein G7Y79_00046g082160 [Physcia stellaris]|nr:hypothetical protein G7Y79_00046g082160 [Physcia stellaris]